MPIQLHSQCAHPLSSLLTHSQYCLWIKEAFWQEELPHRKLTPASVDSALLWSSLPWQPMQSKRDFVLIKVFFFPMHLVHRKLLHSHLNSFGWGEESKVWARNCEMNPFEGMGLFALFIYSCSGLKGVYCGGEKEKVNVCFHVLMEFSFLCTASSS